jgi:hypothetical protein
MSGVISFSAGGVPVKVMVPVISAAYPAGRNASAIINGKNEEIFIFAASNLSSRNNGSSAL